MTKQGFFLVGVSSLLIVGTSALAASNGETKGEAPNAAVSAKAATSTIAATQPAAADEHAAATAEQVAPFSLEGTDLGRMLNRDASTVSIMRLPGGVMKLDVGGGFRSVLVVQITPQGKMEISCIMSDKAAERIFTPQRNKTSETPKEP